MGLFTARNRQNPFAERKRREREQRESEQETAAILADPATMEAIAEAEAEKPALVAVPVDMNPDSAEYTQAPDISTYATGGIVETTPEETAAADELSQLGQEIDAEMSTPQHIAVPVLSPGLQAKIDAIANRAILPVAEPEPATAAEFIATISDPGPAPSVEPQSPPEDEPKRGRGRPRPEETIARDNAVYKLLQAADPDEGVSKEALAVSLDEKEQQVYSSLRQLTKEGRAETRYVKPHGYRWFATGEGN